MLLEGRKITIHCKHCEMEISLFGRDPIMAQALIARVVNHINSHRNLDEGMGLQAPYTHQSKNVTSLIICVPTDERIRDNLMEIINDLSVDSVKIGFAEDHRNDPDWTPVY